MKLRSLSQHHNFGVRRRVAIADGTVSRARHNLVLVHQHCADRNLPGLCSRPRLHQRFLHEINVSLHVAPENITPFVLLAAQAHLAQNLLLDNCLSRTETNPMRELLERLFQVDFIKGLAVTFRTQNPKNIVTEQYPLERPMVAERYRGAPRLNNNPETGETLCIGCNLCALACPENLIVVGWQRDDATRRKVLTNFTYDTSRCMFCGLCEDACPVDALELTQDFEMAYFTREGAIWDRHRLEQGPTPARYTR